MRCRLRAVRWRLDPPLRGRAPRRGPGGGRGRGWLLTALVGLALAAGIVGWLQHQLRPLVEAAARAQAANALTAVIDRAIAADLAERDVDYGDFVTIQRDASGAITAMTTDMAALNQLRAQLVAQILSALEGVDASEIRIPLGSLVDSELVWARGPELRVRALRGGDGVGGIPQRLLPGGGEPDPAPHRAGGGRPRDADPARRADGADRRDRPAGGGDRHCWGGA